MGNLASISYFTLIVIFRTKSSKDSGATSLSLFKMANGFDSCNVI